MCPFVYPATSPGCLTGALNSIFPLSVLSFLILLSDPVCDLARCLLRAGIKFSSPVLRTLSGWPPGCPFTCMDPGQLWRSHHRTLGQSDKIQSFLTLPRFTDDAVFCQLKVYGNALSRKRFSTSICSLPVSVTFQ